MNSTTALFKVGKISLVMNSTSEQHISNVLPPVLKPAPARLYIGNLFLQ